MGPHRDGKFVRVRTTPEKSKALNPAFDVTPAKYVAGIITERGIVPATEEALATIIRR